jgi:tight adherence protein B
MLGIVAILVFLTLALVGYAATLSLRTRAEAAQKITTRLDSVAGGDRRAVSIVKDERISQIPLLESILSSIAPISFLARRIRQSGIKRRPGEVLLYFPLIAFAAFLLGVLVTGKAWIGAIAAIWASLIPFILIERWRRKRLDLFAEQLPDTLDLLRASLQAGHSLLTAFNVVADEFPDPVAEEFRTVADEMSLGLPLREALYGLRERVDDQNVPILTVGILVSQEVGGNLAEVLDNISHTIRERFKLQRDTRVMTAQGRLSGIVLAALPFAVGSFLFIFNSSYFAPMLDRPLGRYMLGYALLSMIAGHLVIQRIVRIKV